MYPSLQMLTFLLFTSEIQHFRSSENLLGYQPPISLEAPAPAVTPGLAVTVTCARRPGVEVGAWQVSSGTCMRPAVLAFPHCGPLRRRVKYNSVSELLPEETEEPVWNKGFLRSLPSHGQCSSLGQCCRVRGLPCGLGTVSCRRHAPQHWLPGVSSAPSASALWPCRATTSVSWAALCAPGHSAVSPVPTQQLPRGNPTSPPSTEHACLLILCHVGSGVWVGSVRTQGSPIFRDLVEQGTLGSARVGG